MKKSHTPLQRIGYRRNRRFQLVTTMKKSHTPLQRRAQRVGGGICPGYNYEDISYHITTIETMRTSGSRILLKHEDIAYHIETTGALHGDV